MKRGFSWSGRRSALLGAVLGLLVCGIDTAEATDAGEAYFSARIGPSLGFYLAEAVNTQTRLEDGTPGPRFEGDTGDIFEGLQLGIGAGYGRVVADLGIDYMRFQASDFGLGTIDRYDTLFSVGYMVTTHLSIFGGYRVALQGDGFFDDGIWTESGAVIGAAVGGVEIGPLLLGLSAAYSPSEVSYPDGGDFDYPGISLKLNLAVAAAPNHALQLRYQRFSGDYVFDFPGEEVGTFGTIRETENLTERFVLLTYVYYWLF